MFESFNVLTNVPMSGYTTLRLGGPADYLAFPQSAEETAALYAEANAAGLPRALCYVCDYWFGQHSLFLFGI